MAGAGTIEDTAGEKQKLGVLRHFVRLQINFYVGFSATAMKNRCVCSLHNLSGAYIYTFFYSGDKRFILW